MSYGPKLTEHLMLEIMRFDERELPGKTVETVLGAILSVVILFINAAPKEERRAELMIAALQTLIAHANVDKSLLVDAARAIALGDVQGAA